MKNIRLFVSTSTVLSIFALPIHTSARPIDRCADYLSYMITADGRCADLSSLTTIGAIGRKIEDLDRQINPLLFSLRKQEIEGIEDTVYLKGMVKNQSRKMINRAIVTVRFETKEDGQIKVTGMTQQMVYRVPAGKSSPINWIVDNFSGTPVVDRIDVVD